MNCLTRMPLRATLAAAIATACVAADLNAATLQADIAPHWVPGDRTAVAALFRAMAGKRKAATRATANTLVVTSCADDGSPGTLRSVVSGADNGDTVDLSGLNCGPITLQTGAVLIYADPLTLQGRDAASTIIAGNGQDRIFVNYGYDGLTLRGMTVRDGANQVAGYKVAGGGCIISNAAVTLDHATVTNCLAVGEGAYGGGILAPGLYMYTSTLSGNVARGSSLQTMTASYGAGAFSYQSAAAVYDSTVAGNVAVPDASNALGGYDTGAGLFVDQGAYIVRSTFSGNYTDGTGGGIASHGPLIVSNSTISNNVATKKTGGGLFVAQSTLTIQSSTVTQNAAARGGGVYLSNTSAYSPYLNSAIVASNFATSGFADIDMHMPATIAGAHNLVIDAASDLLPADTLRDDPRLLPLGFNGGPTQTHALAPTSPARDHGANPDNFSTDQRGLPYSRVYGSAADIGAFEYTSPDSIFANGFD